MSSTPPARRRRRALHRHRYPFTVETVLSMVDVLISWPIALPLALSLSVLRRRAGPDSLLWPLACFLNKHLWTLLVLYNIPLLKLANEKASKFALNGLRPVTKPQWDQEIVVVTGGSNGIGKEVVQMLLEGMPSVRIAVLDLAEPSSRPRSINVRYWKVDVSQPAAVAAAAGEIRSEWGDPTMVVNNAGIARAKKLLDLSVKEFETTLKVNVLGCLNVVKEFLPAMAARNQGHIIHVSSVAAFVSNAQGGDYCASKAGIVSFHEVLTAELRSRMKARRVRTTCICPLKVATEGMGSIVNDHPNPFFAPVLKPWQVAERVIEALDSGLSQGVIFIPSHVALLPWLRSLPPWIMWLGNRLGRLDDFATDESARRGFESGYRILADEDNGNKEL